MAQQAKAKSAEALKNERVALENQYAADINLAQQALQDNNLRQARALLENHLPKGGQPDLRGFEWRYLWRESLGEEQFSFPGQGSGVWRLAFSPDGKKLATGSGDGSIRIWDFHARQKLTTLPGTNGVFALSFALNGNHLAAATGTEVVIWDTQTSSRTHHLSNAQVEARFSPDGAYLLTCSDDGMLLLNTENWTEVSRIPGLKPNALRLKTSFAPGGDRLAVVYEDQISIYSVPALHEIGVISNKKAGSRPVADFSPNGQLLATQGAESEVKVWDVSRREEIRTLRGHLGFIAAANFSPDGSMLATASGQILRLWSISTGELLHTYKGQADEIFDATFSPDGQTLVTSGFNLGSVMFWDVGSGAKEMVLRHPEYPVGFTSEGDLLAIDRNSRLVTINAQTLETKRKQELPLERGIRFDSHLGNLAPDGRTLALWTPEKSRIALWNLRTSNQLCSVKAITPFVCFVNDRMFITQTANEIATLWGFPDGTEKRKLTETMSIPIVSPNSRYLIQEGQQGWKLWKIERENLSLLGSFGEKRHSRYDYSAAFSPDGTLIAAAQEGAIKLWSIPALQEVAAFRGHTHIDVAVVFSADGRTLASMSDDRSIYLWHVPTGRELLRFESPNDDHDYFSLAFSGDGHTLAARRTDASGPITWLWYAPRLMEIDASRGASAGAEVFQE